VLFYAQLSKTFKIAAIPVDLLEDDQIDSRRILTM
jgi:hypothetical protein